LKDNDHEYGKKLKEGEKERRMSFFYGDFLQPSVFCVVCFMEVSFGQAVVE
jgi:hypothetical protein